jgi:O-acetyl-ADP-ribose deacetylase (regulator of RNase III)
MKPTDFRIPGHLRYATGNVTIPISAGHRMIIHICNDIGSYGAGVSGAISKRWPKVESEYRSWHRGQKGFKLGEIQEVTVQSDTTVVNMIAQHDTCLDEDGNPPFRLEALDECLDKVGELASYNGSSVHAPRIGCGLGGFDDWPKIEALLIKQLIKRGINVTIYDLPEAKK